MEVKYVKVAGVVKATFCFSGTISLTLRRPTRKAGAISDHIITPKNHSPYLIKTSKQA